MQSSSRREEEGQTPQQRQAAAKLALRKQLEKTLLQVYTTFFHIVFNIKIIIIMNTDINVILDSTAQASSS